MPRRPAPTVTLAWVALLTALLVLPGATGAPEPHTARVRADLAPSAATPERAPPIDPFGSAAPASEYSVVPSNGTVWSGDTKLLTGDLPVSAAYDAADGTIFESLEGSNGSEVVAVAPSSFSVEGDLPAAAGASGLVYLPGPSELLVAVDGALALVDPATDVVTARVAAPVAGGSPTGALLYAPTPNTALVSNPLSGAAQLVNLTSGRLVNVSVGFGVTDGAFDPGTGTFLLAGAAGGDVVAVSARNGSVVDRFPIPGNLTVNGVAVDPSTGAAYASAALCGSEGSGVVVEFDPGNGTTVATAGVGSDPTGVAFDPFSGLVLVADSGSESMYALDAATLAVRGVVGLPYPDATTGAVAWSVSPVPSLEAALVLGGPDRFAALVSLSNLSVLAAWDDGSDLGAVVADPAGNDFAVADTARDRVDFVNESTLATVASIALPESPRALVFDPVTATVWALLDGAPGVELLNGTTGTVAGSVNVPFAAAGAYDPLTNEILLAEPYLDALVRVNASSGRIVGTVAVGPDPTALTFDGLDRELYVSDSGAALISVLDASTDRVLANWTAVFRPGAMLFDAAWDRIEVASPTALVWLDPVSGVVEETFPLAGLTDLALAPEGSTAVALTGGPDAILIDESTGAFRSVEIGENLVATAWSTSGTFVATDQVGALRAVLADDAPLLAGVELHVAAPVVSAGSTVRFHATVASSSGTVSFGLTGVPGCTLGATGWVNCSVDLAGTYRAQLTATDGPVVRTATAVVWALPAPGSVPLEFVESGLTGGLAWSVTVGSAAEGTSASALLVLAVPPGAYSYAAYASSPAWSDLSGVASANAGGTAVALTFVRPEYPVGFSESGLAAGSLWSVTVPGVGAFSSGASAIGFAAPNGTYPFEVSGPADQPVTPRVGELVIDGNSSAVRVTFAPALTVALRASANPAPVNASMNFTAVTGGGSGPFTFTWSGLPPGCASENASAVPCTPSENGTFDVLVIVGDPIGVAASSNLTFQVVVPPPVGAAPAGARAGPGATTVFALATGGALAVLAYVLRRRPRSPPT